MRSATSRSSSREMGILFRCENREIASEFRAKRKARPRTMHAQHFEFAEQLPAGRLFGRKASSLSSSVSGHQRKGCPAAASRATGTGQRASLAGCCGRLRYLNQDSVTWSILRLGPPLGPDIHSCFSFFCGPARTASSEPGGKIRILEPAQPTGMLKPTGRASGPFCRPSSMLCTKQSRSNRALAGGLKMCWHAPR